MQPVPLEHSAFPSEWQALWTSIVSIWILALGLAMMMTGISFRHQGWRWPLRLCLRACAIFGVPTAVIFLYVPVASLREAWPAITGLINTPERQVIIGACLVAAMVGLFYFGFASGCAIGRIYRYVAAGPPWLPWRRELDRQLQAEFHGDQGC